jgi:hypothetical protein
MLLITYRHQYSKNNYGINDPKCAYRVELGKYSFDFNKGLQIQLKFLDRIPSEPLGMGRLISHTYSFKKDITKIQYDEIRARILAHSVLSYDIIEKIIDDVTAA